jgi:hypothetical protein
MLVVDIPKRRLLQDAADIGHLKKDDRIFAARDGTDGGQEPVWLPYVLEGHFTTEEIGGDFARLLGEEFAYEPYILP